MMASDLIVNGVEGAISVTYDLHRQIKGTKIVSCSDFGKAIIKNM